jgi:hypothetical protein
LWGIDAKLAAETRRALGLPTTDDHEAIAEELDL